jgi:hypothetical protein
MASTHRRTRTATDTFDMVRKRGAKKPNSPGRIYTIEMAAVSSGVDVGLYSRQLYVFGHDGQVKLGDSNVLIVGLDGVGVEIGVMEHAHCACGVHPC